jgi:hypothetical protein
MARFPTRTLVLMVLALLAFGWMWSQQQARRPPRLRVTEIDLVSPGDATDPMAAADAGSAAADR